MTDAADFFAHEQSLQESARVMHIVQAGARVVVVENVPAQVNKLTGEQLFSVETTEWLLQIAQGPVNELVRCAETPVYSFAA